MGYYRYMKSPRIKLTAIGAAVIMLLAGVGFFSRPATPAAADTAAFISSTVEHARYNQAIYRVPASVTIAQSILESGWGRSSLATGANNYFGIKCAPPTFKNSWTTGCVLKSTTEYDASNSPYKINDYFRSYASMRNSFRDHGEFLSTRSRYAAAFNYTLNPDQFVREIAKAGYATDNSYADYIIRLMKQYNLYQYNLTPTDPPITITATLKARFFASMGPNAQQSQLERGAPASVALTQAAYHSNYGNSYLTKQTNNYFGMTCTSTPSPYQTGCYTVTRAYTVNSETRFTTYRLRMYASALASFRDHGYLLSQSRYAATKRYPNSPESFLYEVAKAGYGGSVSYFNQVLPIMRANTLYRFDVPFRAITAGTTGYRVIALQRLLHAAGYYRQPFTGRMDTATITALNRWQAAMKYARSSTASSLQLRVLTQRFTKMPTNQRVAALQALLTGRGYPVLVNGYYSGHTSQRVAQFNSRNYGPTGDVVSIVTWGKLFA